MGFSQAPGLPYRNLGIVEDGDTASQSIEKDKYIIWKGKNYFAKTDILQGETFVTDTNLTEVSGGAINKIVQSLFPKLIWENNSPSSTFNAQTITFDDTYKFYIISFRSVNASSTLYNTVLVAAGYGTQSVFLGGSSSEFAGGIFTMYRAVEATSNSLSFHQCGQTNYSEFYRIDNERNVPLKIWGIKA